MSEQKQADELAEIEAERGRLLAALREAQTEDEREVIRRRITVLFLTHKMVSAERGER